MNLLFKNTDRQIENSPPAHLINDRFINFHYWAHPWAGKFNLNHASGFNSTTVYIKHASHLPAPVFVSAKSGVHLKNDHAGCLQDISLCAVECGEEVFSLKKLQRKKSIRLGFVRTGLYRLRYRLTESDDAKEENVDIVVG